MRLDYREKDSLKRKRELEMLINGLLQYSSLILIWLVIIEHRPTPTQMSTQMLL